MSEAERAVAFEPSPAHALPADAPPVPERVELANLRLLVALADLDDARERAAAAVGELRREALRSRAPVAVSAALAEL